MKVDDEVYKDYLCPHCKEPMIGVEYYWDDPNHYDGISEWQCESCAIRFGKWTRKELKDGESEPVYGIKRDKK